MSFKTLCVYEGLGIWSASYPPLEDQDASQLTSGLLSAIAIFAKHTEGHNIKNMIIGDNDWTFADIGDNDRGFLVLQIPVVNRTIPGQFESELSTVITVTLRDEFLRRYPVNVFQSRVEQGTMFSDFEPIAEEILRTYYAYHERRSSLDLKWLLDVKDSEKLVTAAMDKKAIYLVTGRAIDPEINRKGAQLLAIIEFLSNTIKVNLKLVDDVDDIEPSAAKSLADTAIVDLTTLEVIQGPSPSTFAQKLVEYISNASHEKIKDLIENFEVLRGEIMQDFNFTRLDAVPARGTSFECGLCNQLVKFDIENASSFITKTAHDKFFGMELATYRIAHFAGQDIHVNEVLVDQNGVVTKVVNSYMLNIQEYMHLTPDQQDFHVMAGDHDLVKKDSKIKLFILYNKTTRWIYEISCPDNFKCDEIAKLVYAKIKEQEMVMNAPSPYFSFSLGNNTIHVWISADLVLCSIIDDSKTFNVFNSFAKKFLEYSYYGEEIAERRERLAIVLRCMERKEFGPKDVDVLLRVIFDDTIVSPLRLKFPKIAPQLATRLETEFPIAKSVLVPLLDGKTSILDTILLGNVPNITELFELLDFINRRELIS